MKDFEIKNNWFLTVVLKAYFQNKENLSRTLAYNKPQSPLLDFKQSSLQKTIELVNSHIQNNLQYHSDPLGGTFDYYTDPRTISYMIKNNKHGKYPSDCDDFACYSYALLEQAGIVKENITVASILPSLLDINLAHVILVGYNFIDSYNKLWGYTIDTNGLFWFEYSNKDDLHNKILKFFSNLYKKKYYNLVNHGYPF